jgi:hypothetical protein
VEDSLDDHLFQNFKLEFLKAYVFIMQNLSNYHSIHYSRAIGGCKDLEQRKVKRKLIVSFSFESRCIR